MQHQKPYQLKISLMKIIFIIFLFLTIALTTIIIHLNDNYYEQSYDKVHKFIHSSIKHTIKNYTEHYAILLKRAATVLDIQKFVKLNDTKSIKKYLKPRMTLIQKENKFIKSIYIT